MTMKTQKRISLEEAQSTLKDLVHGLRAGDEIVITEGQHTVARLFGSSTSKGRPRKSGNAKGRLSILKEDKEHLKDFQDYMP